MNPRIVSEASAIAVLGKTLEREHTLADILKRPEVTYPTLSTLKNNNGIPYVSTTELVHEVAVQVEIEIKYEGYVARQRVEISKHLNHETTLIPAGFEYSQVNGLSKEVQQKLTLQQPESIGQASRMSGVTPAAISLLLVHLKKRALKEAVLPKPLTHNANDQGDAHLA